jgi:hypothetical protein
MDLTVVAHDVAAALGPALPYLLSVAGKVTEGAERAVGADLWSRAKSLWAKLGPRVEAHPAALEAISDSARNPDDQIAQNAAVYQLRKILESDPDLATQLYQLLEAGRSAGVVVSGERAVGIGGDAIRTVINTGDRGK